MLRRPDKEPEELKFRLCVSIYNSKYYPSFLDISGKLYLI